MLACFACKSKKTSRRESRKSIREEINQINLDANKSMRNLDGIENNYPNIERADQDIFDE